MSIKFLLILFTCVLSYSPVNPYSMYNLTCAAYNPATKICSVQDYNYNKDRATVEQYGENGTVTIAPCPEGMACPTAENSETPGVVIARCFVPALLGEDCPAHSVWSCKEGVCDDDTKKCVPIREGGKCNYFMNWLENVYNAGFHCYNEKFAKLRSIGEICYEDHLNHYCCKSGYCDEKSRKCMSFREAARWMFTENLVLIGADKYGFKSCSPKTITQDCKYLNKSTGEILPNKSSRCEYTYYGPNRKGYCKFGCSEDIVKRVIEKADRDHTFSANEMARQVVGECSLIYDFYDRSKCKEDNMGTKYDLNDIFDSTEYDPINSGYQEKEYNYTNSMNSFSIKKSECFSLLFGILCLFAFWII